MFKYKKYKDNATLISYNGNEKILHIPETIDGLKVTKMASMCIFGNEEIEEIHFPDNISIENNAIVDCPNLKTIYISKVSRLGNFIEDCDDVEIITNDKSSSKKLKNNKFENITDISIFRISKTSPTTGKIIDIFNVEKMSSFETIKIPNYIDGLKITELGENLFTRSSLNEVILNDFIEELPNGCFELAVIKSLKNIKNIKKVGENCFYNTCIDEEVNFPNLEKVGKSSFFGSNFELIVGDKIEEIDSYGFAYSKIKEISLPKHSKVINDNVFENCKYLEKVTLPKDIYEIKDFAFYFCEKLKEIENLSNVEIFHSDVFSNCKNLVIPFDNGRIFREKALLNVYLQQKIEIEGCILKKEIKIIE